VFEPKLGGDHHLPAKRLKRFAHQFLVGKWAIDLSCIDVNLRAIMHKGFTAKMHRGFTPTLHKQM
jgi:hypothetical protein